MEPVDASSAACLGARQVARSLPRALLSYRQRSAARSNSATDMPASSSGVSSAETPMLMVAPTGPELVGTAQAAKARRTFSATLLAPTKVLWGNTITNDSRPVRAIQSIDSRVQPIERATKA